LEIKKEIDFFSDGKNEDDILQVIYLWSCENENPFFAEFKMEVPTKDENNDQHGWPRRKIYTENQPGKTTFHCLYENIAMKMIKKEILLGSSGISFHKADLPVLPRIKAHGTFYLTLFLFILYLHAGICHGYENDQVKFRNIS